MKNPESPKISSIFLAINEDWLAVIIAFLLILLSVVGLLGPQGLKIIF